MAFYTEINRVDWLLSKPLYNKMLREDLDRVDRRFPKLPCIYLWRKDGEFTMVSASATSLHRLLHFLMTYYYIPRTEKKY